MLYSKCIGSKPGYRISRSDAAQFANRKLPWTAGSRARGELELDAVGAEVN